MTEVERREIDAWIDTAQKLQPESSLAIFVYVRDGLVQVGRGDVPLETKNFPADDLMIADELISGSLTRAYENGNATTNSA